MFFEKISTNELINGLEKDTIMANFDFYNYLDETCNDYIASLILKNFQKDGNVVCQKKYNKSLYAHAFGIVEDFILENLEKVKNYRLANTKKQANEIFSSFDELAQITNEHIDFVLSDDYRDFLIEISQKTGITHFQEYYVKSYLNEKINWTPNTQGALNRYNQAIKIALNQEKTRQKSSDNHLSF